MAINLLLIIQLNDNSFILILGLKSNQDLCDLRQRNQILSQLFQRKGLILFQT